MAPAPYAATAASRWLYVTPFAGQNRYNTAWWRAYWKRLPAEGVIIPGDGADLAAAARADGLQVLARMDMSLLSAADATAHPDWAALDAQGRPIQLGGSVAACVNRGYFKQEAAQATARLSVRSAPMACWQWVGQALTGRASVIARIALGISRPRAAGPCLMPSIWTCPPIGPGPTGT